jgi:hypothetical protein
VGTNGTNRSSSDGSRLYSSWSVHSGSVCSFDKLYALVVIIAVITASTFHSKHDCARTQSLCLWGGMQGGQACFQDLRLSGVVFQTTFGASFRWFCHHHHACSLQGCHSHWSYYLFPNRFNMLAPFRQLLQLDHSFSQGWLLSVWMARYCGGRIACAF